MTAQSMAAQSVPRMHPRVEANFVVKLFTDGKTVMAKARDLSMAGLSVIGEALGDKKVKLAIALPNDREVVAEVAVTRREPGITAVEFVSLDWDDMFALARYLHPRLP